MLPTDAHARVQWHTWSYSLDRAPSKTASWLSCWTNVWCDVSEPPTNSVAATDQLLPVVDGEYSTSTDVGHLPSGHVSPDLVVKRHADKVNCI